MMEHDILKKSVKSIQMPGDMEKRIIENTHAATESSHITPTTRRENTMKTKHSNTFVRRPARKLSAVLVAVAAVMLLGATAFAGRIVK